MAAVVAKATATSATDGQIADPDSTMTDVAPAASQPRKFKASELPLTSATRSAIEGLAHAFKKKGGYDTTRKNVWETFEASVCDKKSFNVQICPAKYVLTSRYSGTGAPRAGHQSNPRGR